MGKKSVEVSVIVPVHNEASILEKSVKEIEKFVRKLTDDYELIIAEDGSTDGSYEIALKLAQSNPRIKVFHKNVRVGKGTAIKEASMVASGNVVAFIDVDLSPDPAFLPVIIRKAREVNGVAVGSRLAKGAIIRGAKRALLSLVYNTLVRILFRDGISDHQCGLKAWVKEVNRRIVPKTRKSWFFWDTELIVRSKVEGFNVVEVPIRWTRKAKFGARRSRVKIWKDSAWMLAGVVWLFFRLLKEGKLRI